MAVSFKGVPQKCSFQRCISAFLDRARSVPNELHDSACIVMRHLFTKTP